MTHLLLAFFCLISACSSTQTERIDAATPESEIVSGKTLIVYLSRTNNTKAAAEIIQKYEVVFVGFPTWGMQHVRNRAPALSEQ